VLEQLLDGLPVLLVHQIPPLRPRRTLPARAGGQPVRADLNP
jgi:hypothetical protein